MGESDDEVPLSPNMLLRATSDSTDADRRSQECEVAASRDQVCSRLRSLNSLREHFHRRLISGYLLSLRLFHQNLFLSFLQEMSLRKTKGRGVFGEWLVSSDYSRESM